MRVGTTYIPVKDVELSTEWYVEKLGAYLSYKDSDKAIINLANQSFFLVKSGHGQSSNFIDAEGNVRFSLTFEMERVEALEKLQSNFKDRNRKVGEIENRGHAGRNFYDLDGNIFDV